MAIFGRRRVGKTRLITEYIRSKNEQCTFLYYQCMSYDYRTCLADFLTVSSAYVPQNGILSTAGSFKDAISYITKECGQKLCIIIDDFPFLAKKRKDAVTEFQWIIDHGLNGQKMILLGSNRSFMKNQIQHEESPLYGRFDEILEIKPFTFEEVLTLFPSLDDAMQVYATTGGVAQYVSFFMAYKSVQEAMASLFFCSDGRLIQEAFNMLLQELRDSTTYERIFRALGSSDKTTSQISAKSGLDSKGISAYLNKLIDLNLIEVVSNPLSKDKRNTRYRICDLLFRFHYSFIEPNMSIINSLQEKSMEYILNNQYQEYLGFVYEDIIRQRCYSYALVGKLPFMPVTTGKWLGNIQEGQVWKESEIDVIAYNDKQIAIGEYKYRNKKVGLKELLHLQAKVPFVNVGKREVYYLLASKSGFTDELLSLQDPHIILIDQIG